MNVASATTSCGTETLTASIIIWRSVAEPRDQLAGSPLVELPKRQVQQPFEEAHAQARDQMLAAPGR